jgi:hypothetical protein
MVKERALGLALLLALAAACAESAPTTPASGLRLRPDSLVLAAHGSLRLEPAFIGGPAEPLGFASDNLVVATVDSLGLVRARWPGIATIRAQSLGRPSLIATSRVTVTGPALRLVPDSLDVASGWGWARVTVQTTGLASGRYLFRSSNSAIARVDSTGLVCPGTGGRTLVHAQAADDPRFEDSAVVRVVSLPPPPVPAGFLSISDSTGRPMGSGAVSGTIRVTALWFRYLCDAPATVTVELRLDTAIVATSAPKAWIGTDSVVFRLDTRALTAIGRPLFPDGDHTLGARFLDQSGATLLTMGTSLRIANGTGAGAGQKRGFALRN